MMESITVQVLPPTAKPDTKLNYTFLRHQPMHQHQTIEKKGFGCSDCA